MEGRKTLLFYLLGLVGLVVVSILSTSQIERVEIRPLPTHTPTIAITPQSTAILPVTNWIGEGYPPPKIGGYSNQTTAASPETSQIDCATVPAGITFGYLPDAATLTNLAADSLTISGTVYASDFMTPLPDVLIEVWRATPEVLTMVWGVTPEKDDDFPPFILLKQVRTDAAGRYAFTTPKPDRITSYHYYPRDREFRPIYFYYRLSYQGHCPASVKLLALDTSSVEYEPSASNLPQTLLFKQVKPADMMVYGPVDITLPISPPTP